MIKATLIGNPVDHSVAPILHSEIAKSCGMGPNDFAYVKTVVEPGRVREALDALELLGFVGGNVTLPIKLEVMHYLEIDESARMLGAVNTFEFRGGKRYGYNTDWQGVVGALRHGGLRVGQRELCVILGSGGAARAVIYAAKQLGFNRIVVFYETPIDEKTKDLQARAGELGITLYPYDEHLEPTLQQATVIYNTSSTGMTGFAPAPFDLSRLSGIQLQGVIVADAVFNPVQTPLLQAAGEQGATMVDGVWWTVFQGHPSFSIWTKQQFDPTDEQLTALHDLMVSAIEKQH